MSTLNLNIQTSSYPTITNNITVSISKASSPAAIVDSIVDTTSGHPSRLYTFSGLERTNYIVSIDETDISTGSPVANLHRISVVPSSSNDVDSRDDEQIQVGTPYLVAGQNVAFFNGSNSSPDYRGWEIVPSELGGRGILVEGVDYSWNKANGRFKLLIANDVFQSQQWYNIHFNPITKQNSNSFPSFLDLQFKDISSNYNILASDFGKELNVFNTSNLLVLTLPDISTVPSGRPIFINTENVGSNFSVIINPNPGDTIEMYSNYCVMSSNERICIYKATYSNGSSSFKVKDKDGNFDTFGNIVVNMGSFLFKKGVEAVGQELDVDMYYRFYNLFVAQLPSSCKVNFDDWSTSVFNKTKFGIANSANLSKAGKFIMPDLSGLYCRISNSIISSGTYQQWQFPEHKHESIHGQINPTVHGKSSFYRYFQHYTNISSFERPDLISGVLKPDGTSFNASNIGNEVRPESFVSNLYFLI